MKKQSKLDWGSDHGKAFVKMKKTFSKNTNSMLKKKLKCDLSKQGLELPWKNSKPMTGKLLFCASRFLIEAGLKYSINEVELLAVIWAVTHYRKYSIRDPFKIVTDHKALLSCLSEEMNAKTTQTRLVRWVDRLLLFDYEKDYIPGKKLGLVD